MLNVSNLTTVNRLSCNIVKEGLGIHYTIVKFTRAPKQSKIRWGLKDRQNLNFIVKYLYLKPTVNNQVHYL